MPNFFYEVHFYLFGLLAIASSIAFVTRKSPVSAALWLARWSKQSPGVTAISARRFGALSAASRSTSRKASGRLQVTPACASKALAAHCTKRRLGCGWPSPGATCPRKSVPPYSRPPIGSALACLASAGACSVAALCQSFRAGRRSTSALYERARFENR